MKCLGETCGSHRAEELNVSVNVSETEEVEEVEYTGSTEYGDPSEIIGTYCSQCGQSTFVAHWRQVVMDCVAGPDDTELARLVENFTTAAASCDVNAVNAAADVMAYLKDQGYLP
jgi:hypothetical protein